MTQSYSGPGAGKPNDEIILFSHGSTNLFIPSLQAFWRSSLDGRSTFGGAGATRPISLPALHTASEEQNSSFLIHPEVFNGGASPPGVRTLPGFVVTLASRLVIFVPPPSSQPAGSTVTSSLPMRLTAARLSNPEQTLLESGELDIDGMDRILNTMAHSSFDQSSMQDGFGKKSVGFHFDADEDTDMGTPTSPKNAKSRLIVSKDGDGGRRLFT
jgi:hypothetical protein